MARKAIAKRQVSQQKALDAAELSRHLLKGEEEERRRISRELHDETGQALMVLRFQIEMLASDTRDSEQQARAQESLDLLDQAIEGLRRIIARLSPRVLEEVGLLAAIRRHAQLLSNQTGMKARVDLPESLEGVDHDIEVALYRSAQEALHNISKHSQARSFEIRLRRTADKIDLEIEDDGKGLLSKIPPDGGFGLTGMRERTVALGGSMAIHSRRGRGTQIRIVLPFVAREPSRRETAKSSRAIRRVSAAKAG